MYIYVSLSLYCLESLIVIKTWYFLNVLAQYRVIFHAVSDTGLCLSIILAVNFKPVQNIHQNDLFAHSCVTGYAYVQLDRCRRIILDNNFSVF